MHAFQGTTTVNMPVIPYSTPRRERFTFVGRGILRRLEKASDAPCIPYSTWRTLITIAVPESSVSTSHTQYVPVLAQAAIFS